MTQSTVWGAEELAYLLDQMSKDYGVESAEKNVLIPAARNSMKIVLAAAKANLYPGHGLDTGQLQRTLQVNSRMVKPKDHRSKYIEPGDLVISQVSALISKRYVEDGKGGIKNVGDVSDGRAMFVEYGTKNKNKIITKEKGVSKKTFSALQREFGTVRMAARPYLRPALEANAASVTSKLKDEIASQITKYKAKLSQG